MTNVHGISVSGGSFPAQIWRLFMSSAIGQLEPLSFPEPTDYPEWRSFERGTFGRSFGYSDDSDSDYVAPSTETETETEESEPEETPAPATTTAVHPRKPKPRDHRRRSPRRSLRRRRPSRRHLRSSPERSRPLRLAPARRGVAPRSVLLGGCVTAAWLEGAPLAPSDAGRGGGDGGGWVWVFLACLAGAFALYLVALWLLRRRASVACGGRRAGGCDPAAPARGAAPALDGRLGVLAVRGDRGGGWKSVSGSSERVSRQSRLRACRVCVARHDLRLRACFHARLGGRRPGRRLESRTRPPGRSRCSRRSGCSRSRAWPRGSRETGWPLRRSSAGIPSSRSISPEAVTTTR